MAAIARACASGELDAEIRVVVGNNAAAPALAAAEAMGLNVQVVPLGDGYAERLLEAFRGCDVICLAGYLRLLPVEVLQAFPNRVLNIHPSLLPKFGGKGMYGHHVHEAVIAAGETESGCSVHEVNEVYDDGRVILQFRCPVLPDDTPETLAARILPLEHAAFPAAIAQVLRG